MYDNIFTISDVEMGRGDVMDDFHDDEALINFLQTIGSYPGHNLLILNGDTFDFLKMDYKGEYTRYITEEISLWKLEEVIKTHPKVFSALRSFLEKGHAVFFVIGNHDFDLEWPALQQRLREVLGQGERISFGHHFYDDDIHVEHGNSVDTFYTFNIQKPFIKYRGKTILNLPFGYYAVVDHLIDLKKEFSAEEQLYPRFLAMDLHPEYKKSALTKIKKYALKGLIIEPLFKFYDPTFRIPYHRVIRHIYKYGFNILDDRKFVHAYFEELMKKFPKKKAFVLGHTHIPSNYVHEGYYCLMTDTWRNEFEITPERDKNKKVKTYVEINYRDRRLHNIDLKTFEMKA